MSLKPKKKDDDISLNGKFDPVAAQQICCDKLKEIATNDKYIFKVCPENGFSGNVPDKNYKPQGKRIRDRKKREEILKSSENHRLNLKMKKIAVEDTTEEETSRFREIE